MTSSTEASTTNMIVRRSSPTCVALVSMIDERKDSLQRLDHSEEQVAHNERMTELDLKLESYNLEIAQLKARLLQSDQDHEHKMEQIEQRETEARQDLVMAQQESQTEQEDMQTEMRVLEAKLQSNWQIMNALRKESKTLAKELKKVQKELKHLQKLNGQAAEAVDNSLMYSDLGMSGVFDTNLDLIQSVDTEKEEHERLTQLLKQAQERYMGAAQRRRDTQATLAQILGTIQDRADKGVSLKVAKACTKIGLKVQAKTEERMKKLEDGEE